MAIGPTNNYPSLQDIADLVRTFVNDDKQGKTGTPGEGQILTNSSGQPQDVTLLRLMNSAIRETYRDIRIAGQPTLIKDNYILYGLPVLNSVLGEGVANPAIQTSLQYVGFFDGLMMNSNFTLPGDMIYPLEMWERQNGTQNNFSQMKQVTGALSPRQQLQYLGQWEWRSDSIWMNGATELRDIRLRYICTYANLASLNTNWATTFIPIMDCQEAVADKITVRYARRLGGDSLQDAMMQSKESILRLRQQVTRARQKIDYQRPEYGQGAGQAGNPGNYLY